ncbi:M1 family metallopeptidase [Streptomyces iconiensis]|uniref:Aminopeptidase N n=1 Tax=Streptomyces iconiensis TaxID=1384038 RepID=A0ABT6ZP96_9ACTN|nr:M1 family metallopeptidase [Streptomyces iconiensis]MDJ1130883.1 M1 family metallopeptidase [Streptomyces iconiensis]
MTRTLQERSPRRRTRLRGAVALGACAACLALALPTPAAAGDPSPGAPSPGAPGAGDPLFPRAGNGGYDVRNYDLSFDFTPGSYDFTGTMKISAVTTQALSSFHLDTDGHTIDRVTVDGRRAAFKLETGDGGEKAGTGQELVVTPAQPLRSGRHFEVTVAYHGNGKDPRTGAQGWSFISDGGFVSTVQATRADTFAPVNDTPSDKATWDFHLTAPKGWTAAANGKRTGKRRAGDTRTTWDFALDSPMAPELMGISVAKQTELRGKGPHGLPLRHYVPSGQVERYKPVVERTGGQIAWLEKQLGAKYPFDTYGVQIVKDGYDAALENQTLSVFSPNWFKDAEKNDKYTTTMVHELTHQWFGDSVTPSDWQQAWLNEGPAVYYAARWADDKGFQPIEEKMKEAYGKLDAVRKTDGPPGLPTELGGFNIYDGAAVVLYALSQETGEKTFDRIMRSWVTRHAHSNASSRDFIRNAVEVSGDPSLTTFLKHWLYDKDNPPMPGHPDWS